ncbi:MAG: hypothetical protein SXV54_09755 [Chloroflexota bacterium]|nr:hypothetical protein [Chloroflexota bacterium]
MPRPVPTPLSRFPSGLGGIEGGRRGAEGEGQFCVIRLKFGGVAG